MHDQLLRQHLFRNDLKNVKCRCIGCYDYILIDLLRQLPIKRFFDLYILYDGLNDHSRLGDALLQGRGEGHSLFDLFRLLLIQSPVSDNACAIPGPMVPAPMTAIF